MPSATRQPSWQNNIVPLTSTAAASSKGLPDISMDADFLLSPATYYLLGATTTNGGTSLASPLALGAWARIETSYGNAIASTRCRVRIRWLVVNLPRQRDDDQAVGHTVREQQSVARQQRDAGKRGSGQRLPCLLHLETGHRPARGEDQDATTSISPQ